ncbi:MULTISPECIES: hypothetical protein [Streptomyces]|uniref:Uncharacterized protein n=1 Tax=Streptomyces flaveolus TaxID=67297 RepID=A0ABV3A0N9_9ACTN|nr:MULTISPECIES: hypothetical protein [Streptomyces]KMS92490.1 hypothetical protein ACZ91_04075 [Streptomyces regensis]KOG70804.1 hypothetical protein ADK77_11600 [Streptomyces antibioticus]KOV74091.1 hypothetical protein ADL02_38055 [Streptomyces sp. NRRL WC-3723]MBG7704455.1 hypothetical protein [Streptomyces sp. MC1]
MNESGTGTTATPVEERLRAALAARAHSVGPADLRPLRPPTRPVRSRRVLVRRAVAGVLVLAAVAALVFLSVRGEPARPAEPARSPRPPIGTPTPVPSPVSPSTTQPSPSARQP